MKFEANKVGFGRHESFHLRYAWITKGVWALQNDPNLFSDIDSATVTLGVGKNMVHAIRYWLRVTGCTDKTNAPTDFGKQLCDETKGLDPYLEDQGTLWLLHWKICSNTELTTTFAWFFNKYHKTQFSIEDAYAGISTYINQEIDAKHKPASATVKRDLATLVRSYTASFESKERNEEELDSPLSELGLLQRINRGEFISDRTERSDLPSHIIGYTVIQLLTERGQSSVPLEDLVRPSDNYVSISSIFRLTESGLMSLLERFISDYRSSLSISRTAGNDQFFLRKPLSSEQVLEDHYSSSEVYDQVAS